MMEKEITALTTGLATRNEIRGFLKNLEKMRSEGTVTEDQYRGIKAGYEEKLNAADMEILRVKGEIGQQLQSVNQQIEALKAELDDISARHTIGEFSSGEYQKKERRLQSDIGVLQLKAEQLRKYLAAESSADIAEPGKKRVATVPKTPPPPGKKKVDISGKLVQAENIASRIDIKKLPKKWLFIIGGVLLVVIVFIVVVTMMVSGGGSGDIKVPLNVVTASNVGSLHIELTYDSELLIPVSIQRGSLAGDSLFSYNLESPGGVVIGIANSRGFSGDGTIAIVEFRIKSGRGAGPLTIENIQAYDATTLSEIPATATAGIIDANNSVTAPALTFIKTTP